MARKSEEKDEWKGPVGGGFQDDGFTDPDALLAKELRREAERKRKRGDKWSEGLGGGFRDDDGFS